MQCIHFMNKFIISKHEYWNNKQTNKQKIETLHAKIHSVVLAEFPAN